MREHSKNAEKVADFLKNHKKVEKVIYPSEVAVDRAKKYLNGGNGGLMGFEIVGGRDAERNL